METYHDNWNACLLFRNKQLTKQLKEYQNASVLAECSSSLLVSLGQLLRLHQNPSYGIIREETEWTNLFTVLWRLPVRAVIFIRAEYAGVKGMLSD